MAAFCHTHGFFGVKYMQVSVENISNIERRLTITVPANQVEEAYERHIAEFAKKAKIKGFRPGKVPQSYIKQHYGQDARREALGEIMQKALYDAISEQKLNPISQPRVEPKLAKENEPFEFVASFEVLPEIEKAKKQAKETDKEEERKHFEAVVSKILYFGKFCSLTCGLVISRPKTTRAYMTK